MSNCASFGVIGTTCCAFIAYTLGERLERKYWFPIAALLTVTRGIVIALNGSNFGIAAYGSIVLSLGSYLWLPIA